ncbi:glycosyltransferase family 1 protein [Aurantivibrio infirmus]
MSDVPLRVSIVGSVGVPAKYGGWETLVEYLIQNLAESFQMTVYCSSKQYSERLKYYNGAQLEYVNLQANGIQSIFYDLMSMCRALNKADIILVLGVSGCVFLPLLKKISSSKFIVNIDGIEWKRQKWGRIASWFLKLSEQVAINYADEIVADNKAIQSYILKTYNRSDSVLIEYGADHVSNEDIEASLRDTYPALNARYAFSVCRIEPENNLDTILKSFSSQEGLPLIIVGNWDASVYGRKLRQEYHNGVDIFLVDPIYELSTLNQLRSNCFLYIHGHSAGGTNPSLVEAMYLGLPIFAYNVEFNVETTYSSAVYFGNQAELEYLIRSVDELDLNELGLNMSKIAKKHYLWRNIARKYSDLILDL